MEASFWSNFLEVSVSLQHYKAEFWGNWSKPQAQEGFGPQIYASTCQNTQSLGVLLEGHCPVTSKVYTSAKSPPGSSTHAHTLHQGPRVPSTPGSSRLQGALRLHQRRAMARSHHVLKQWIKTNKSLLDHITHHFPHVWQQKKSKGGKRQS